MLKAQSVSAWYGQTQALWEIDISLDEGELVGVLGRNGAGKTTLLRTLAGLQVRTQGSVVMLGEPILGLRAHKIALKGMSLVREGGKMAASLTVEQHLSLGMRLARNRGKAPRSLDEIWRTFPIIEPFRNRNAGLLSGGQRQALGLATAYISRPEVMLLDEPSAGLSPQVAHELFETLKQLAREGSTIFIVEQHPAWLLGLADRAYLLEVGRITAEGRIEELLERVLSEERLEAAASPE